MITCHHPPRFLCLLDIGVPSCSSDVDIVGVDVVVVFDVVVVVADVVVVVDMVDVVVVDSICADVVVVVSVAHMTQLCTPGGLIVVVDDMLSQISLS